MNRFISLESLNRFDNDPIVSSIIRTVNEFRGLYNKGLFDKDPWKLMGDKRVAAKITKLENDLYNRFGIKYRLLLNATSASIFYVPTHDFAATGRAFSNYYEALEEYLKGATVDPEFRNVSKNMYKAILDSARDIREAMLSNKPIKVDEKKAKIVGLPNAFAGVLNIGFYYLFKLKMTDAEIAAVLMHEIGHGFTSISSMNQSFTSVMGIVEVLQDVKGSDKRVISLVEETYGVNLNNHGTAVEYIVANQLFKNAQGYTLTNSEFAADQFAARFGLSVELSTGLAKIYGTKIPTAIKKIAPPKVAEFGLVLKLLEDSSEEVSKKMMPVLALALAKERTYKLEEATMNYDDPASSWDLVEFTYDVIERRIERLKRDVIRQMRTLSLSDEQKKVMINEVKSLEIMVFQFSKDFKLGELSEFLWALIGNSKAWKHRKFFTMIEDLTENDFHIQKEKYKLLKGK